MKRTIAVIFGLFLVFEAINAVAAYQPHSLGWVNVSIASATLTEINASTASTVGVLRYCTNCAANGGSGTICVSTSTSAPGAGSDFVLSTGTQCK